MSNIVLLEWKPFNINLDRTRSRFSSFLSSNFNGLIATQSNLKVIFNEVCSQSDLDLLMDYWNNLTESVENTPTQQEMTQNLKILIMNALTFGQNLIIEFASENVALGITQSGKTSDVLAIMEEKVEIDSVNKPGVKVSILGTIQSGSLYESIKAIEYHILKAENGDYDSLAPFITSERLTLFKVKIQTYLEQL